MYRLLLLTYLRRLQSPSSGSEQRSKGEGHRSSFCNGYHDSLQFQTTNGFKLPGDPSFVTVTIHLCK